MEKKQTRIIEILIVAANLAIIAFVVNLYLRKIIILEVLLASFFCNVLILSLGFFIFYQYQRLKKLAKELGFKYIKSSFPHPKYEGHYKSHWWQLHFVSRETGDKWGMPMTYIKLQWKEPKKFDEYKLHKYNDRKIGMSKIVEIKYIVRDSKNYLLLKRAWYTFNKKKIYHLMDLLLKIARESEIK